MSFEKPENFLKENKEKETMEKEKEFRKFLNEQISLPKEKWSESFKLLVLEKYEQLQKAIPERTPEEEQKINFERYLKSLDLKEDDLKDKKILDLGCGKGEFVKECLKRNISQKIYGLDLQIKPEELSEEEKKYFFQSDFQKELPINNLDLIVSLGAIEAPMNEFDKRDPEVIIGSALKSLKEGGEMRIFPLRKTHPNSNLEGIKAAQKKWQEILEKLTVKEKIKYEIQPIDIKVSGKNKDVWLEQVLIIKKPNNEESSEN